MSNIDDDVEHCIKVEMQTLYPEEYERIYGNSDLLSSTNVELEHTSQEESRYIEKNYERIL